jgi:cysteine-S-conjugate beta-lyase
LTDNNKTRPATTIVQGGRRSEWTGDGKVVNPPVWRASTILYDDTAALKDGVKSNADGNWFYGRRGTPTQWALAEALTALDPSAAGTMLYPSGVAAVAGALLSVLKPGDHLLMVDSTYDPTSGLCNKFLARHGITTTYYDPLIGAGIEALPAIVAVAKKHGLVTLIDNTWATPLFLPTAAMGVDLSIIACTKYIVGHSDVMIGSVTASAATWDDLRATAQVLGQYVSPDDAYLALRGLRTLEVRLRQHQAAALEIAQWLRTRPEVAHVRHPALPECPGHAFFKRDFSGSTGLFSFTLAQGDPHKLVDALAHFGIGYSWGGFESLAVSANPALFRSATRWAGGTVIRLSIGLEDVRDLIDDLGQAIARS